MKIFLTNQGYKVERVSRWIRIDYRFVTKNHSLYYYSDNGDLVYFKFGGRRYALGQFMRFDIGPGAKNPVIHDKGEDIILSGYDSTEYYKPLMIEINKTGEAVRLYREVTND